MYYFYIEPITQENIIIIVDSDSCSFIPADPLNMDYVAYLAWVAEGNTAEQWNPANTQPESEI